MITFHGLDFSYDRRSFMHDLSLTWRNGCITGLVGPNGSGKSTCLKLAANLLSPQSGRIMIDGKDLSLLKGRSLGRNISYLPQHRPVPAITVKSMVSHGRFPHTGMGRKLSPADWEAVNEALTVTGLENLADRDLRTLSGGQQQKAYLALLMAQNAPHVLLDEPTTYLDIRHQLELFELLKGFRSRNKCVVVVLHDLNQAFSLCDEVQLLHKGRLLSAGSPSLLAEDEAVSQVFGVRPVRREGLDFDLLA